MELKKLREKINLTQTEVARISGINLRNYNKYENNVTEPDIETLCKLADFYHVTIDELVGHETNNLLNINLLSETEQSIINIIRQLNKDFLLKVEAYAYACLERQTEENKIIKKIKGE